MAKAERVTAIILLILAVVTVWQSLTLPPGEAGKGPGPGAFPMIIGLALGILALLLLVGTYRGEASGPGPVWPSRDAFFKVGALFILLFVYVLTCSFFGFLLSTMLFVLGTLRVLGLKSWPISIIFTLIVGLIVHQVFITWLTVPLPAGFLGI